MNENEREMERRASILQLTQMRSVTGTVYGTGVQSTVGVVLLRNFVHNCILHTYSLLELEHYRVPVL